MMLTRRRCGVLTGDVLDTIAGWPAEKQLLANQAIREVEEEVQFHLHVHTRRVLGNIVHQAIVHGSGGCQSKVSWCLLTLEIVVASPSHLLIMMNLLSSSKIIACK